MKASAFRSVHREVQGGVGRKLLNRVPNICSVSPTALNCVSAEDLVNAIPDCKRRLEESENLIADNMRKDVLDVTGLQQQIKDMEMESSQPDFWDDADKAQKFMSELNKVKALVSRIEGWRVSCDDIQGALDLCAEDPELADEFITEALITLIKLEKDLEAFELERLLGGKYDKNGCTLCIQSGAGGTEAQDWAGMLYRMYKRFCERKGFQVTVIEEMAADFGIKSCEIKIEGDYAYGYLGGEKGTHRLVRISPFNAQGKRQTSFAGVETYPIIDQVSA